MCFVRAAEATLFWTSIPGTFLGSSVGRLMPCRQVHLSLPHGFLWCAAETESPTCSFLPSCGSTAPWTLSTKLCIWSLYSLIFCCDCTHGHILPTIPETGPSKLFAINGEAGNWKKVCMSCLVTSFPSSSSLQTSNLNLCNTIYLLAAAYLFASTVFVQM